MPGQSWTPPNIAEICPEAQASLTQCTSTGYVFLALLAQIYGGSQFTNNWQYGGPSKTEDSHSYETPYRSQSLKEEEPELVLHKDFIVPKIYGSLGTASRILTHGSTYNRGPSETSKYFPSFEFQKFGHSVDKEFAKTDLFGNYRPHERYNYENPLEKYHKGDFAFDFAKHSLEDFDTARSENVNVKLKKKRQKRNSIERYDFIVVGAGSAGCVIANRLSEVKNWKVLLLEAGPEEPDVTSVPAFAPALGRSSIDWMYRTQPEDLTCRAQRGQTCAWLSGKVMGGSSSINYVVYMRGNKKDYDEWAELGNKGWSFNDVLPYFKKSENNQNDEAKDVDYHGTGGPLNVERFSYTDRNVLMIVNAFNDLGFPLVDFNGKQQIGTMTTQTTTKAGKRVSSNEAFIKPIRKLRRNLVVRTNSQVTKILIDSNKIAYGVQFLKNNELLEVYANKEIIISAGALNSPKILMLSGIGPKKHLEDMKIPVIVDLMVGYNLQDHATTEAVLMGLSNKTTTLLMGPQMLDAVRSFSRTNSGYEPLSAPGPLQVTAFHQTKYADEDSTVPDIQYHFDGRNKREFYSDATTYLATNIFPFSYYDAINVRPILLHPESRGFLTLNRTHPISGQPLIYPRFFTVKRDLDVLVASLKFAVRLESTRAFKENGVKFIREPVEPCEIFAWGSYKYFACVLQAYTGTIYHPAGTCKMGTYRDPDAVVDSRLRVYGIDNLRVADASIMPHIVRGNTNAPCMMIGEKVSDMIKEDWGFVYWNK